jgi:hypothetical protein
MKALKFEIAETKPETQVDIFPHRFTAKKSLLKII